MKGFTKKEISLAASILGKRGGSVRSEAKKRAAPANGAKGGKPRLYPPCPYPAYQNNKSHRFSKKTNRCYGCGYERT